MKTRTIFLTIMSCLFVGLAAGAQTSAQRETADLLPEGTFTNGIEGSGKPPILFLFFSF